MILRIQVKLFNCNPEGASVLLVAIEAVISPDRMGRLFFVRAEPKGWKIILTLDNELLAKKSYIPLNQIKSKKRPVDKRMSIRVDGHASATKVCKQTIFIFTLKIH